MYVGVYRDQTGWGQAALDYILALDAAGVDVVCRPLKLNERQHVLPERIRQLEAKSAAGADVVIQHVLPHQMDYSGHFARNIGLFASETSHFRSTSWADRLNCMDEVWVINRQQVEACRASGVKRPVRVVPHATDVARFQRSYKQLESLAPLKEDGGFTFYCIGEMVRRKNLFAALQAFHLEFDPSEPVNFVVKTDVPGKPRHEWERHLQAFCDQLKTGLKLHGGRPEAYKREVILLDRLTDEGILRLHASCDCFVMPSYGEAWCIPAFDAMAMGKTPIVTDCTGFHDYVSDTEGWLVKGGQEPVFGETETFRDLYTGDELWFRVCVQDLRRCMRQAYEDRTLREDKSVRGMERAYDFSHEAVGLTMKGFLDDRVPE